MTKAERPRKPVRQTSHSPAAWYEHTVGQGLPRHGVSLASRQAFIDHSLPWGCQSPGREIVVWTRGDRQLRQYVSRLMQVRPCFFPLGDMTDVLLNIKTVGLNGTHRWKNLSFEFLLITLWMRTLSYWDEARRKITKFGEADFLCEAAYHHTESAHPVAAVRRVPAWSVLLCLQYELQQHDTQPATADHHLPENWQGPQQWHQRSQLSGSTENCQQGSGDRRDPLYHNGSGDTRHPGGEQDEIQSGAGQEEPSGFDPFG